MNKIFLLSLLIVSTLFSVQIPTAHVVEKSFGKSVGLNAKVIQLANAKQSIMSLVSGHIEHYYVTPGSRVQAGQRVALIESIMLSKMTADFLSLKKQFIALEKNYKATHSLYEKGMASMQDLNTQSIQKNAMLAKIATLKSQLNTLGINTQTLKKASADYILYAHSAGKVSTILQSLHSVIGEDTAIVTIVKSQAFYIESYLPLEYVERVKVGQKIIIHYNDKEIVSYITQILPELDEVTQRVVLLSRVDAKVENLYNNSYLGVTLYFDADKQYPTVKKSALSFFNGEWVVFVPTQESGEETPYEPRVIEIISQNENYVAVKGLEIGEEYVSDKSYYVKSMILKSSLGDGD